LGAAFEKEKQIEQTTKRQQSRICHSGVNVFFIGLLQQTAMALAKK